MAKYLITLLYASYSTTAEYMKGYNTEQPAAAAWSSIEREYCINKCSAAHVVLQLGGGGGLILGPQTHTHTGLLTQATFQATRERGLHRLGSQGSGCQHFTSQLL